MTVQYKKLWDSMNELEMVTSKVCSAREILDSAINALENHKLDKAEALMYATSEFLQYFVRLGVRPTMDFTFLCKAFGALSERTLETMNDTLAHYALAAAAAQRATQIQPEHVLQAAEETRA